MPTTRRAQAGRLEGQQSKAAKVDAAEYDLNRWRQALLLRHSHMQILLAAREDDVLDFKVVLKTAYFNYAWHTHQYARGRTRVNAPMRARTSTSTPLLF